MEGREKRTMPRLLSVNVGLPRDIAWQGKTVHTAFGRPRFKAGGWCAGSTLMATGKEIWRGMAANTGRSLSTRSILSLLAKPARSKRLHLWPVRREFYSRGTGGY